MIEEKQEQGKRRRADAAREQANRRALAALLLNEVK